MNKKLLWTLALPAVLASCSQDDLISEGITNNAPQGKAISGVTFTIAKNGSDANADTRAEWVDNKISFEQGDLVSLFWLGEDGYTQNNTNGTFNYAAPTSIATGALNGRSNAVFRTEDGATFTAEAVVYEGYNLLVYPGDTKHVEDQQIVVSLPTTQDASEDFTENVIYVGDSILHIHQPALNRVDATKVIGGYYNAYGNLGDTEDPNTSGYAHGIQTGVKLLSSLLNMNLRIINTNATDVKIQKVVLRTINHTSEKMFATSGNLVADAGSLTYGGTAVPAKFTSNVKGNVSTNITEYRDPWFAATTTGATEEITLDCEDVETVKGGTKVTMLLLPADLTNIASATNTAGVQPVLDVYTNYGVVRVGGNVESGDAHSNCIFESDGVTYAADNDNEALQDIVTNTANYVVRTEMPSTNSSKAYYYFKSGVSMTRVINVDMQKANIQDQHVKNTEELNSILNAAVAKKNASYDSSNPLRIYLDYNMNSSLTTGSFTLTNFEGIDAFVEEFDEDALSFFVGDCINVPGYTATLNTVIVNTTSETVLKNIPGLPTTVTLTIPASSKINAVANGNRKDGDVVIENAIINQTTITVPQYAEIKLQSNGDATTGAKYTVHYTAGADIDVTNLRPGTYGTIDYTAENQDNLNSALAAGANYVTVKDITSAFFAGGINAATATLPANLYGDGVTIVFDHCGNWSETISTSGSKKIEAKTIVLTNGTTYSNLTNATVENIIVESETATLGIPTDNSNPYITKADITGIWVKAGSTVAINNLDLRNATVQIDADATATIAGSTDQSFAPKNFYVYGTASFAGSNGQLREEVFVYNNRGQIQSINYVTDSHCLVTGALELDADLAYQHVAVGAETAITTTNDDIIGLGFNKVYVTNDDQATNTENLQFITTRAINAGDKTSWNGNFSNLGWGNTIPW